MESESWLDVLLMRTYVLVGVILLRKVKIEMIDRICLNKEAYGRTQKSWT